MAGLNQEIWTDVLVEEFRNTEDAAFLSEITDYSQYVASAKRGENQTLNLVDVGADPNVIVNNITYPIGSAKQVDGNIAISLDTYVTEATEVSDEEIQFIAYDKIKKVQEKHTKAVMNTKHSKAVHALAPSTNAAATPVLKTTGENDGAGRKRLTLADLLRLKSAYDTAKIPLPNRILVLGSDHYNDLLLECLNDKKSTDHLSYDEAGLLKTMLFGFKTYLYIDVPYYTVATSTKKAFGEVAEAGDFQASVSFYAPDMFRASGLTKNYTDEPTTQNHAWLYNVRHNYIVLPRKQRAIGAIISDIAA